MELDLEKEFADRAYQLLACLIVPRPIALVTTINADGKINAAPFSFFNLLGTEPPILGFSPGMRDNGVPKDTLLNIRDTHDFVVNIVDEEISQRMNKCAASLSYGENELEYAGLNASPSTVVRSPRILESPASLECIEWETLPVKNNRIVIGMIKRIHLRDELFDPEKKRIQSKNLSNIGRMALPYWYCRTTDQFQMIRPA